MNITKMNKSLNEFLEELKTYLGKEEKLILEYLQECEHNIEKTIDFFKEKDLLKFNKEE